MSTNKESTNIEERLFRCQLLINFLPVVLGQNPQAIIAQIIPSQRNFSSIFYLPIYLKLVLSQSVAAA
ncbi:hypothetical protein [Calothrix sp. 336/3]|uniref:hypothetical protein n=1 Tax=Calothrix sp. 336/3 TaxID=1337936 RepID=UPI0011875EB4|nr:hypothetical protein [Calothrix sp. 336/3]